MSQLHAESKAQGVSISVDSDGTVVHRANYITFSILTCLVLSLVTFLNLYTDTFPLNPPPTSPFHTHTHHLCLNHVADGLVEGVDLVRLEVADDGSDVVEDLFDERHHLQLLDLHEMAATLLSYLDERVASHVLDAVVGLCGSECVCV